MFREQLEGDPEKSKKEENVRKWFEGHIQALLKESNIYTGDIRELIAMFSSEKQVEVEDNFGFIDSDHKNIVIEYKHYKRLSNPVELEKDIKQLTDYLCSKDLSSYPVLYGFLLDGDQIHAYIKESEKAPEKIELYSGSFDVAKLDFFVRCLINYDKKDITPYNIKNDFAIISSAKNGKATDNPTVDLFRALLAIKKQSTNERTSLLFHEWEKMFKLSNDDNGASLDIDKRRAALSNIVGKDISTVEDEYDAIFCLHTIYAILLKLIAIKAVRENNMAVAINFADVSKTSNDRIKAQLVDIENGTTYKKMNILNMSDGDFFSWYVKEDLTSDFYDAFKNIALMLSKYENFNIKKLYKTQDFFTKLYEACIPAEVRHSFGEYYTPYWLADAVVSDYLDMSDLNGKIYRSIDPTCGSGTFVMVNIRKLLSAMDGTEMTDEEKVKTITTSCYGIDLNPLAVLGARINYLMNIGDIYDGSYPIEIPIYLGDSSYMPEIVELDGIECVTYDFYTDVLGEDSEFIHFCLPKAYIQSLEFADDMNYLESIITSRNEPNKKKEEAYDVLIESMGNVISVNDKISAEAHGLVGCLVELETRKLNSIWLNIFSNYLKSSVIDRVDVIAGNPPWVAWGNLPEKYREKLKVSCKDTGIFSNDTNTGGVTLDICALIAMKCLEKYANEDGRLCFLMPKAITHNKSFEGFRNLKLGDKRFYFEKITEWTEADRPFDAVNHSFCCFVIGSSKQDYSLGIPYISYKNKRGMKLNDPLAEFSQVKELLKNTKRTALVLDPSVNNAFTVTSEKSQNLKKILGKNEYVFRKGLGLVTEVHKLVYVEDDLKDPNVAIFHNYTMGSGNRKQVSEQLIPLEKAYVRPFVESPCLNAWNNEWQNQYVTFPYEDGDKNPLTYNELKKKAPKLAKYLLDNKATLESGSKYNQRIQNTGGWFGIIRTGDYMFNDCFAVTKDNSRAYAAPFQIVATHWGTDMMPVFDGHISYITTRNDGDKITTDEMYYLIGILNCPLVISYVENTTGSRSRGLKTYDNVNIPLFDQDNSDHQKISSLAKSLEGLTQQLAVASGEHKQELQQEIDDTIDEIQSLYLSSKDDE